MSLDNKGLIMTTHENIDGFDFNITIIDNITFRQCKMFFENGFGISITKHTSNETGCYYSHGTDLKPYEIAFLLGDESGCNFVTPEGYDSYIVDCLDVKEVLLLIEDIKKWTPSHDDKTKYNNEME